MDVKFWQLLLEAGCLKQIDIDEDGDPIYMPTLKCKEFAPTIYEDWLSNLNLKITKLWRMGMCEIEFNGADIKVYLTSLASDQRAVDGLPREYQKALNIIKEME